MLLTSWLPTWRTFLAELASPPYVVFEPLAHAAPWAPVGSSRPPMRLHYYSVEGIERFNGYEWSRITARNWKFPLAACACYVCLIPLVRGLVTRRLDTRRFTLLWNVCLSAYSVCGVYFTVPVLLGELRQNGLYFTTCASAAWYGFDYHGLFVALFIYSKFFELVDTLLLLLAKRPVIVLHWWHHTTVLLYCWHSYAAQIATGLWFAAMNYCVHSCMYVYFAVTQTPYRSAAKPFAIYVTLLQLAQMVVGIFVTLRAVAYQLNGEECHVNRTNSILGLAMYSSYFVLFLKLFLENYVFSSESAKKKTPGPSKQNLKLN
jgi:elongation of very long chain fatty acids protein 6